MFLNRLCWWTSILSFVVFCAGVALLLVGLLFAPLLDQPNWGISVSGPTLGCVCLAYFAADLHDAEEVDPAAPAVTMDSGRVASGAMTAVLGAVLTTLCAVGSYHLMTSVLFA